jgi:hypothetical protein
VIGSAPAFELELGAGTLERACAAAIWAVAFTVAWIWLRDWLPQTPAERVPESLRAGRFMFPIDWLAAASVAAGGAWFGWRIARPLRGRLIWDGSAWALQSPVFTFAAPLPSVSLGLDLGSAVVLRTGAGAWCLVTAGQAGPRWHALQLALRTRNGSGRRVSST